MIQKIDAFFIPIYGTEEDLAHAAFLASLADPTPMGQLVSELALEKTGPIALPSHSTLIYSDADPRICGIDFDSRLIRKGTLEAIEEWLKSMGGYVHSHIRRVIGHIVRRGGQAIVIANESMALGVICLRPR